jgi:hypothetical protein
MRHVWNNLHHVRSAGGISGITWWRLFQTCLMLNVHDEGYSRHASCWTYMMKAIPDMPHAERTWWRLFQTWSSCTFSMRHVWNNLHHVRSAWGMTGITFNMYVQHEAGYSRHASCWTYMLKVIPDMPHAERTWWRLFQTCFMLNVHDEGYSRHASCWMYMMKVIPDMPHAKQHVWNNLHHVRSAWGMSGITFNMYVQHEACLE